MARRAQPSHPLLPLAQARRGHFRLESGHHTDSWLDLDLLFAQPRRLKPFVVELAARLSRYAPQIVCGPLTGGAFLAQMIASELEAGLSFAERRVKADRSVMYSIAPAFRSATRDQRVALVDDAISAGSAVRATLADLEACGATVVVIGALILVGDRAPAFAAEKHLPLEWLERVQTPLWDPSDCPRCAAGEPLNQMSS